MIELKKYISRQINTNMNLTDELTIHFYVEFVLNESFNYSYFAINEKYASYIGQKELVIDLSKEIYNIIRNHEPVDTITIDQKDLNEYNNIFFDKLIIYLYGKTGYLASKSKYINDNKIFDKVVININPDEYFEYKDIVKCLVHELLHAYNEYKNYLTDSKFKISELTDRNSSYYKTIFSSKTDVSDICKRICNNIRKWEQNAYISELSIELENNHFNFDDYKTTNDAYNAAYELFKKSDMWTQYSVLWSYIIFLNGKEKNDADRLNFESTYNHINNTSLSFHKIYKRLDGLFNKIFKRIESLVPKIFYNYYEEQMNQTIKESNILRQNMALIKFTEYINNYNLFESVKPENGKEWEVYFNGQLDNTFTENAKHWKKYPKVGQGWYAGGTVFKIVKIEDNKVYTEEDKNCTP